jgi:ribosomal protein L22
MGVIDILIEDAREDGLEKGVEKEKVEVIRVARHDGMSIESIARIVRLSPQKVRSILDELKIE